jgi:glycosyltransferase involved in cell wall biosynthesis
MRLIGGKGAWVVIHDPVPLTSTTGYDWFSIRAARLVGTRQVVVHSEAAALEITKVLNRPPRTVLPLPLLRRDVDEQFEHVGGRPSVLVFGQFKPDRDIELLTSLGDRLSSEYELNIVGRRWPAVSGWNVRNEFIPEDEVEPLLAAASVVLIPYRRFYQSDVAIRCIELGVPVVGLASSSLREMLGANSPLLVSHDDPEAWINTIRLAASSGRKAVGLSRVSLYHQTQSAWSAWAKQ